MVNNKNVLLKIISRTLNVNFDTIADLQEDEDLREYGLTSHKAIELIVNLENELGIAFAYDCLTIESVCTMGKIKESIENYLS